MTRVIVCGTRTWSDEAAVAAALRELASAAPDARFELVVGDARGADEIAAKHARALLWDVRRFIADWEAFGRAAGPRRNEEMARAGADLCLAFWDGKSRGTLHMMRRAAAHGIPVRIFMAKGAAP